MNPNHVRVGLAVYIINKEGKVLLGKRKGSHAAGDWATPGGHLEVGENWEQCAQREIKEETGIEIKNIRLGTVTNDIFEKSGKHYITLNMLAEYVSGEPRVLEPEKCEKWEWFDWDDLPSPLMISTRNVIAQGFDPRKH
jgi:8-oxo-dGTP diphosphatase